jgi:hypothetical protein
MPYALRKVRGKELYFVINKDTGKRYSTEPMPKARAERQLKALYVATKNG